MFRLTFLPARFGDSIWIEYCSERAPHRVLIDGGTAGTRRDILRLLGREVPESGRHLDLLVVTHIDRDHIEGVLGLLEEADGGLEIGDVWFNGWGHLPQNPADEAFGPVQGERLSKRILELGLPWNEAFGGEAIVIDADGDLPHRSLPGGLEITLLGPTRAALARLRPVWEREVREANLDPGFGLAPNDEAPEGDEGFGAEDLPKVAELAASDFKDDRSEANGSSIAFLAEFEGRRILFAADAPATALGDSLDKVSPDGPLELDLYKVSHHGSRNTTSRELVEKVRCPRWAFSTNGSIFKHPHHEAVARVIAAGSDDPELVFNYRSRRNSVWDLRALKRMHGYRARYPEADASGITIKL